MNWNLSSAAAALAILLAHPQSADRLAQDCASSQNSAKSSPHAAAPLAPELFDLRTEPPETHGLSAEQPEEVARMRALQSAFWDVR